MNFGQRRLRCTALAAACALGSATVDASSCFDRLLRQSLKDHSRPNPLWAWRNTPTEVRVFDAEVFAEAKARYLARKPDEVVEVPSTFEERLALFEVKSLGALKIEDQLANEATLKEYFRILKPGVALSEAKLRETIDLLYLAQRTDPPTFRKLVKHPVQASAAELRHQVSELRQGERNSLYQRIVNDVTTHQVAEVLGPQGLLRDEKIFEAFGPYGRYRDVQEGALAVLLNAPVALVPGYYGVIPPSFNFLKRRRTPPELIQKALREGIDAVYEDMKALYGQEARFDHYWEWARKTWAGVFAGLYLTERQYQYELEDLEEAQAKKLEEIQKQRVRESVRKKIEETAQVDINGRLLARWEKTYRQWYRREFGRDFTQASPADRALYEQLRQKKIKELYAQ